MGRELRRKQAKKEGKSLAKEEIVEEYKIKKLVTIVLLLVFIIGMIYVISATFVTKEFKWGNKNETQIISDNSRTVAILASEIFKQSEDEYYVYFYNFDEKEDIITEIVFDELASNKIYSVNTVSAMNANYVTDNNSNKKAKTLNDLKVIAPTLIKITGGIITEYYEKNEIINKLT